MFCALGEIERYPTVRYIGTSLLISIMCLSRQKTIPLSLGSERWYLHQFFFLLCFLIENLWALPENRSSLWMNSTPISHSRGWGHLFTLVLVEGNNDPLVSPWEGHTHMRIDSCAWKGWGGRLVEPLSLRNPATQSSASGCACCAVSRHFSSSRRAEQ